MFSARSASVWLGAVLAVASLSLMAVPVLTPSIASDLELSPHWLGVYSGLLWAAALVASARAGTWINPHAAWKPVQVCLALCALGLLSASLAPFTPLFLLLAAILIGIANGIEAPVASLLLSRLVTGPQRAFMFSLKQTGVQWGALTASLSLPALIVWIGWRGALLVLAAVAVTLLLAVRIRVARATRAPHAPLARDSHEPARGHAQTLGQDSNMRPGLGWWASLAAHPDLRRLAGAASAFGATQVCLNGFLVTFFVTEQGYSLATAGVLAAAAQTAGLVGRLFWGWLASSRVRPMRLLRSLGISMGLCSIVLGASAEISNPVLHWATAILFGLSASGWNGIFLSEVATRAPDVQVARITGAVMVVMTLGLVFGPLGFSALSSVSTLGTAYIVLGGIALLGAFWLPRAYSG